MLLLHLQGGLEPVLGISFSGVQLRRVVSLMNGHNTLRKHLNVMDFVMISEVGVGKNLIRLSIYYMSVML